MNKEKQLFISVYEEEFKDYYDKFFSKFPKNEKGLLIIDTQITMSLLTCIYWILTTDNINGITTSNNSAYFEIINDEFTAQSGKFKFLGKFDINNSMSLKEQINSINDMKIIMYDEYPRWGRKINLDDCHNILSLSGIKFIFVYELAFPDNINDFIYFVAEMPDFNISSIYSSVGYFINEENVQSHPLKITIKGDINNNISPVKTFALLGEFHSKCYENVIRQLTDIYEVLGFTIVINKPRIASLPSREITLYNNRNFELSDSYTNGKDYDGLIFYSLPKNIRELTYTKAHFEMDIKINVIIYPIMSWLKTWGYELNILNGYCGNFRNEILFRNWAKNMWNVEDMDYDILCEKVKQTILNKIYIENLI